MIARVPFGARLGIAFILLGIALRLGWTRWMDTRIPIPLDIPVALSGGQIRTDEFRINMAGTYAIEVDVDSRFDPDHAPCLLGIEYYRCKDAFDVVKASWVLADRGRVVAQGTSDDDHGTNYWARSISRNLGSFNAGRGDHYVLTLDVLQDGSRLKAGNPRLKIDGSRAYWQYEALGEDVFFLMVLLVTAGSIMFIRALIAYRENRYWRTISVAQPGPQMGVLHLDPESGVPNPPEPLARKGLRLTAAAWLGIGCIVLGAIAYAGAQYWMATHTFVAYVTTLSMGDISLLRWLSALCVAVGISLVILFSVTQLRGRSTQALSFGLAERAGPHFQWARKFPLRKTISGPPSFGLLAVMVYLVSLAGLGVIESLHPVTVGLNVHLLKAGAVPVSRDFGTEPVVLRLKASSREYTEPPGLYLRSKHVSWSGLEGALQDDLKSRSDRVVYLEGDPEMAYNYAVKAIDIIRRAQGEVVMLTPDRRGNETRPEALHRKGR